MLYPDLSTAHKEPTSELEEDVYSGNDSDTAAVLARVAQAKQNAETDKQTLAGLVKLLAVSSEDTIAGYSQSNEMSGVGNSRP